MGLLSIAGVMVDISGNLDPLRRDIRQAERELGNLGRNLGGGVGASGNFASATNQARGFFNTLRSGAQDVFFMANAAQQMYAAFSKPFGIADDLAQMGYQAERSRIALTNMLGSAEEYEKWIRAVKDATKGTVTETEAAGLAFQALRLGLASTSDEAGEFVRVATIIGAASPQLSGTADAISEISLTIANMSWRRLDQLGLSVTEVKDRMEELQRLNADMSAEEAFGKAVLEGLTEQANILGDEMLEVGANTQRWKTVWEDIKTDVGVRIGEGFDGAIVAAESLYEIIRSIVENPWKALIIFGVDYEDAEAAWLIGSFMWQMTKEFVKGKAQAVADIIFPNLQIGEPEGIVEPEDLQIVEPEGPPLMFGLGRYDSMLLSAQLALEGYGVTAETQAKIDRYFEQYYAAQERAIRKAAKPAPISPEELIPEITQAQIERLRQQQRDAQIRRFREADAASYADPRRGRFGGIGFGWYGVTEAVQMLPDMVEMARQRQAYEDMLVRRAAPPRAQSLDEFFQISPDRLDTEVYGVMARALRDVGVNAEVAAEAMKLFEWQTGMTTPTAELFNAQVDVLTQKLNTGEITAAQFAEAMARLAQTDLSPLAILWEADLNAGDWEAVTNTIERLSKIDLDFLHLMTSPMSEAGLRTDTEAMQRDMWEPGEAVIRTAERAQTPLQQMRSEAESVTSAVQAINTEGSAALEEFSINGPAWFATWSSESLPYVQTIKNELTAIEDQIGRLVGSPFVITLETRRVDTTPPAGAGARYNYAQFEQGGYTGDGSGVAGIVHKGEYVVPRGGALVLEGRRSSGLQINGGTFIIQGVQNVQQLYDELQQVARRRA